MIQAHAQADKEVSERKVIFQKGIPGFPDLKEFILERNQASMPFAMLKAVGHEETSFCLGDPFVFFTDYEFDLPEDAVSDLQLDEPSDAEVWGIISYRGSVIDSTINLQAPVIINKRNLTGKQVILNDSRYIIRQPLFVQSKKKEDNDAGIEPKEG